MRVFVVKAFGRFQRQERIEDTALCEAIGRAERGLVDADLGHGLIKQRVARIGKGRRGGYRTVIAYRFGDRAIFLFGFAKNDQDNIGDAELAQYGKRAARLLSADDDSFDAMIDDRMLREVPYDGEA